MTQHELSAARELLIPAIDPDPVELVNPDSASPFLLICEHAGNTVPKNLADLGLTESQLGLHIAYDIGAQSVATDLARRLGCTLIMQRYSRLVIDCNRPPGVPSSIPEVSDNITIPGNQDLSEHQREQRERLIFLPYASAARREIAHAHISFSYAIHSFTPYLDGVDRPWDIGFLFRHHASRGEQLARLFHRLWPEFEIGYNEPYRIEDATDWFIPVCAETRGVAHCLIEIRNDHLLTPDNCRQWANRLYRLFKTFKEQTDATHS